jgi:hypothetical protein
MKRLILLAAVSVLLLNNLTSQIANLGISTGDNVPLYDFAEQPTVLFAGTTLSYRVITIGDNIWAKFTASPSERVFVAEGGAAAWAAHLRYKYTQDGDIQKEVELLVKNGNSAHIDHKILRYADQPTRYKVLPQSLTDGYFWFQAYVLLKENSAAGGDMGAKGTLNLQHHLNTINNPTADNTAPLLSSATADIIGDNVEFTLSATDNSGEYFYCIVDEGNTVKHVSFDDTFSFPAKSSTKYNLTVWAADYDGNISEPQTIEIVTPFEATDNLALGKNTFAESINDNTVATNATDGNHTTHWHSNYDGASVNTWIYVDLGAEYFINSVVIDWKDYRLPNDAWYLQIATEAPDANGDADWTTVFAGNAGNRPAADQSRNVPYSFESSIARYVKIQAASQALAWGMNLWEIEVYGTGFANEGGDLDTVIIYPQNPVIYMGNSQTFSAIARDEENMPVPAVDIVWSCTECAACIDEATGVFTPDAAGSFTITATATKNDITVASSTVATVRPADYPLYITFDLNKAGGADYNDINNLSSYVVLTNEAVPFIFEARDYNNAVIINPEVIFSAENNGVINGNTVTFASGSNGNPVLVEAEIGGITANFPLVVVDAPPLAKAGWVATASSTFDPAYLAGNAIDGNNGSRWVSQYGTAGAAAPEWLVVDMGVNAYLDAVEVIWEGACAKQYQIEVSATGGEDDYVALGGENRENIVWAHRHRVSAEPAAAVRYIRIKCDIPATGYGYSIFEINAFGYPPPPTLAGTFNSWVQEEMSKIGNTHVYKLTKTLTAGTHEYKVLTNGNYPDWWGANRVFTLTEETEVTFYAKIIDNNNWLFVCDAQPIYLVGDVTGGGFDENPYLLSNKTESVQYFLGDINNGGNYMLKVYDINNFLINNDVMKAVQNINDAGKYKITFVYETFEVTAQRIIDYYGDAYVYEGAEANSGSNWYSAEYFNGYAMLDNFTLANPLRIGGDIQTYPVVDNASVKMFYQVDNQQPKEIDLPFFEMSGNNAKWQSLFGTNVFGNINLAKGEHDISVWYEITLGTGAAAHVILLDNNGAKYTAQFVVDEDISTSLTQTAYNFTIFPNPASDIIYIEGLSVPTDIIIVDAFGKIAARHRAIGSINVSSLPRGLYFIGINNRFAKIIIK